MNKKQLVLLGLSLGLMGMAQSAEAFKFGPRVGLYSESFDDGHCYKEKEFGLQLGFLMAKHPDKECKSGNCGQQPMMAPAMAPMPVPMMMPAPVVRPAIQYLAPQPQATAAPVQIIQKAPAIAQQPQQLPQLKVEPTVQQVPAPKKNTYVMVMPPKNNTSVSSTSLPPIASKPVAPVNVPSFTPQEISQLPSAPMPSPMYDNSQIRGLW